MKSMQLIIEDTIANLMKQLNIKVKIDKTKHAKIRQSRHSGDFIADKDIIDVVSTGLEKIAKALLFNEIDIGDHILLKRKYDNLNIVTSIEKSGDKIDVVVITVMKTPNFHNKPDTKILNI